MRGAVFIAMGVVLGASALVAATGSQAAAGPVLANAGARAVAFVPAKRPLVTTSAPRREGVEPWAVKLGAVRVTNKNTDAEASVRLYRDDGSLDADALKTFMRVASRIPKDDETTPADVLDTRLVRLVFRAAYHFGGAPIVVISGTRKRSRGRHRHGEALDFALEGVRAATLASHLRGYPRAGVGIYTNPRTQYVHLDVRDRSYHRIDASPPGVTWRERLLPDPSQAKRDASYVASMDLPE
jgi:uncharacterized protein YcbK (DUF882 family)